MHLDARRAQATPPATAITNHIGFQRPDALRWAQRLRVAVVQNNGWIERNDIVKNSIARKGKPRCNRAHRRPDRSDALSGFREQEPLDRLDRVTAFEQCIQPLRSEKLYHGPMMKADAPITCEAEERALQQRGPCLGAPILQNLGHIERCLTRLNAVSIGAMPQRELAGQHRGQRQSAGTLDRRLLGKLRSLLALDARL